jgi:hypothetical protein
VDGVAGLRDEQYYSGAKDVQERALRQSLLEAGHDFDQLAFIKARLSMLLRGVPATALRRFARKMGWDSLKVVWTMKWRASARANPWMPASQYAAHLIGLTVNLMVRDVAGSLPFYTEVLELKALYSDPDFAALEGDPGWFLAIHPTEAGSLAEPSGSSTG